MRTASARPFAVATALTVVVGALLRFIQPDLVLFKFDEATAAQQVAHMLRDHVLLSAGTVSSVGAPFPPLFDYLMVPPFLISPSPVLATAYVAALNVLALILATLLVRRYVGPRAGYLTAVLYALSPVAVVDSRKIWDPYVIPLLAVLALWGLLAHAVEHRRWGGPLFLLCWLWLLQIHPSTALLAPVGLLALWLGRSSLRAWPMLGALCLGLLPLVPYLARDQGRGWQDLRRFLQAGSGSARVNLDAVAYVAQNASGFGASQLEDVPYQSFLHPLWTAPALAWVGSTVLVVGIACAGIATVHAVRCKVAAPEPSAGDGHSPITRCSAASPTYTILLLWLLVPVALTLRHGTPLFSHYFMALLPVTFIVIAAGVDALCLQWPRGAPLVTAMVTSYAVLAVFPLLALFAYLRTPAAGGWQYARYPVAVQQAVERILPAGLPVTMIGTDSDSGAALVYLLEQRYGVNVTAIQWTLLVDAPRQVVVGPATGSIIADLLPSESPPELIPIAAHQPEEAVVPVSQLDLQGPLGSMRPLAVHLANGITYRAWTATQPSPQTLRVTLGWHVDTLPPDAVTADYAPYVHLVHNGRTVAQHDGVPYPSARWAAGQTLYAWFDLPLPAALPPGRYELRTGMYTRPDVRRVAQIGPQGLEDGEFSLGQITLPLS